MSQFICGRMTFTTGVSSIATHTTITGRLSTKLAATAKALHQPHHSGLSSIQRIQPFTTTSSCSSSITSTSLIQHRSPYSSSSASLSFRSTNFQRRNFSTDSTNNTNNNNNNNNSNNNPANNDSSSKPSSQLVKKADASVVRFAPESLVEVETDFLPIGQLPKTPNMLLLPLTRPIMPGLSFDFDLRLYPTTTRAAIEASIASGQPYITLALLQPSARADVLAQAEQHWTKEERIDEGLERPDTTLTPERKATAPSDLAERVISVLRAATGDAATPKQTKQRVPIYPVVTDTRLVYSMGVAAEIKIVKPTSPNGSPRLTGCVHRRVAILGPAMEDASMTSEVPAPVLDAMRADAEAEKAANAAAAADIADAQTVTTNTTTAPTSTNEVMESTTMTTSTATTTTLSDSATPPSPVLSLRVRVKHIEDARLTPVDTENAATTVDPTAIIDLDLDEKAYVKEINQTINALSKEDSVNRRLNHIANSVRQLSTASVSPGRMADLAAHLAAATELELQSILESTDIKKRLESVLWLWKKEQEDVRLQKEVQKAVQEKYQRHHVKHNLREEKKVVEDLIARLSAEQHKKNEEQAKKEGKQAPPRPHVRGNDKEALRQKFLARIAPESGKVVPEGVRKVIDEEMAKLASMESDASEYQVTRNYIDSLTNIPWGKYSKERFDIDYAEEVLNKDHYGLDDVKQRIFEFIASGVLLKTIPPGKILCLVGPPGVGKTSIGKSIARALDRQFYRLSVGGMDDVSEIKGHRRTYIGSMPGKLVQALKRVECSNPVILIDEIDKLSRGGHRGDPASALLEVLDPEQNKEFMDHYLDVPVDLSKVLFICTANERSLIPGPLADRMDFITLSGYVLQEKVSIAQNHLIPLVSAKTGVDAKSLTLTEDALVHLIRWYCREAGVRGLQRQLEKIYQKVALKLGRNAEEQAQTTAATDATTTTPSTAEATTPAIITPPIATAAPIQLPITITSADLVEYVGKPPHTSDRMYEENPVGVATGLGTNSLGGSLLYTECTIADQNIHMPEKSIKITSSNTVTDSKTKKDSPARSFGRGELFCTGQLGDVIRESSSIAYTVAKRLLAQYTHPLSRHRQFFNRHRIHLHLPEGATPKDGPSAGITMVTSLLSLALDTPPIVGHAMTGELTLTGLVLPIGGVKEKLMAAKLAGCTLVVLPEENRKDVIELKPYVIEGLTIKYAKTYEDVFTAIFPHFRDDVVVDVPVTDKAEPIEIPSSTTATSDSSSNTKKRTRKTKIPPTNILPPVTPTQPTME